jgi:hypothetical protein
VPHLLQIDSPVETLEQPLPATEHHRRYRHDELVPVPTGQRLADRVGAT